MCVFRFPFLSAVIPDSQVRPEILGGKLSNEEIKNAIPETVPTPSPKVLHQPFDYDGEVYVGTKERKEEFPEEKEEEEEEEENQLNPRGDVFSECLLFSCPVVNHRQKFWSMFNTLTSS